MNPTKITRMSAAKLSVCFAREYDEKVHFRCDCLPEMKKNLDSHCVIMVNMEVEIHLLDVFVSQPLRASEHH